MNNEVERQSSGRRQLLLVMLVFAGPLILAVWLYYGGASWQPTTRSNHGALLEPIINLTDEIPGSDVESLGERHWLLVYTNPAACDESCEQALFRMRQTRAMLGNEMSRVRRLFLHGSEAPDRVLVEEQHAGLITTRDRGLAELLERKRPAQLAQGGIYLIDPLTNLVMYFAPGIDPRDMVDDLKHLLELSRIG